VFLEIELQRVATIAITIAPPLHFARSHTISIGAISGPEMAIWSWLKTASN